MYNLIEVISSWTEQKLRSIFKYVFYFRWTLHKTVPFCPPSREIIPVKTYTFKIKVGNVQFRQYYWNRLHYCLSHYFIVGTMAAVGIVMPIVGGALGGLFSYFFFKWTWSHTILYIKLFVYVCQYFLCTSQTTIYYYHRVMCDELFLLIIVYATDK